MGFRKLTGMAAVTAALTMVAAGCNPAAKDTPGQAPASGGAFSRDLTGTLKTSGYNPSDDVAKARSDLATEKVAPVKVSMDTTSFDPQKFAAQAASGNVPDLITADRIVIDTLADKNLIMPMDQCFTTWGVDAKQRFYPAALAEVTYDGKIFAAPQSFQTNVLIADDTVLKQAGVSVDQLDTSKPDQVVAAAKKMAKTSGGNPSVIGFDADLPDSAGMWLKVFGGAPVDADGKPTLDGPENVAAVTWMKQLLDAQGGYAKIKSFKDSMDTFGDKNQYVRHQVGVQTWGQWYVNVLAGTKDDVSLQATQVKDRDGRPIGYAGGSAVAIPKASKNPSAACAWAMQVTSTDAWRAAGAARAKTNEKNGAINTGLFTGSPEADKAVRDAVVKPSGRADFDQVIDTTYGALENPVSFGGSAVGKQVRDALGNAVTQAVLGNQSPQEALAAGQQTALRAWEQSNAGKTR